MKRVSKAKYRNARSNKYVFRQRLSQRWDRRRPAHEAWTKNGNGLGVGSEEWLDWGHSWEEPIYVHSRMTHGVLGDMSAGFQSSPWPTEQASALGLAAGSATNQMANKRGSESYYGRGWGSSLDNFGSGEFGWTFRQQSSPSE